VKKIAESKPWLATLGQASVMAAVAIVLNFSSPTLLEAAKPHVPIIIWIANYAKVPRRELSGAERTARSIFHDAWIETTWLDLPLEGTHLQDPKYDIRPGEFFLRILGETAPHLLRHEVLGYALPCEERKIGCGAYISYPAVEALAYPSVETLAAREVSKSEILGVAMAHEIGHLLLGGGHSSKGIMKSQWNARDLREVSYHHLNFTLGEAKHLYAAAQRLRARICSASGKHYRGAEDLHCRSVAR